MADPFNLQRFLDAQEQHYGSVLKELRAGRKTSHWMWYIFPQVKGLGGSAMSHEYAISSPAEARAYCDHPILGKRLRECTQLMLDVQGRTLAEILSYPDDLKFRSCMTLFAKTANEPQIFEQALRKYSGGELDHRTLDILKRQSN
jgi:uncharacterized protein (DUF1810 family)